ncbi:hypothetical protein RD792_007944 [Penstemon davidsonii]|uniref:Phosphatidic acid phosphatase type 2/haloperoxidase domain-containing protein n=1 Tax=Penstemon davidsonii TaxID=160366 RepID=A0ABR0D8H1_9LAMI|nr:hypothetical protein RD792_007944 [Penstemon davidsonii]
MIACSGVHANMSEEKAFIEGSFGAGGLQATLNTLSKWVVTILFGLIVLWRHDAEALWAFTGAVLNAILSLNLKKIINQKRPISTLRSDPGMPSSHAQSIFYIITFLNLSMIEWYGINGLTTTLSGLFFLLGSYFSWLRVSQQLHTVSQVIVGGVLGSIFSIFWFWSWNTLVINSFISSLTLGVVRIFVVLGSIVFCVGFMYHVFQKWIMDEG